MSRRDRHFAYIYHERLRTTGIKNRHRIPEYLGSIPLAYVGDQTYDDASSAITTRMQAPVAERLGALPLSFKLVWPLVVSGSDLVASFRAEDTREVAMIIIDMGQLGERDVVDQRDDAIAHVRHLADAAARMAGGQPRRAGGWQLGGRCA